MTYHRPECPRTQVWDIKGMPCTCDYQERLAMNAAEVIVERLAEVMQAYYEEPWAGGEWTREKAVEGAKQLLLGHGLREAVETLEQCDIGLQAVDAYRTAIKVALAALLGETDAG